MLIAVGTLCVLVVSAFATWRLWFADGGIEPREAREIALNHMRSSPHLENLDMTRVSVTYRDDLLAYVVDTSWKGADEIQPDLWTAGYYVVVDARSGDVTESYAYER